MTTGHDRSRQPPRSDAAGAGCCTAPATAAPARTDLLVGGYVESRIDALSDAELDALEAVLELPDPDLADWLTGRRPIPAAADCAMLRALRDAAGQP